MSTVLLPSHPILLEDFLNDMFQASDMLPVRNIHCQTSGSEIILRGCVGSADLRQLAQSMAKSACGMRDISNEITVVSEVPC